MLYALSRRYGERDYAAVEMEILKMSGTRSLAWNALQEIKTGALRIRDLREEGIVTIDGSIKPGQGMVNYWFPDGSRIWTSGGGQQEIHCCPPMTDEDYLSMAPAYATKLRGFIADAAERAAK